MEQPTKQSPRRQRSTSSSSSNKKKTRTLSLSPSSALHYPYSISYSSSSSSCTYSSSSDEDVRESSETSGWTSEDDEDSDDDFLLYDNRHCKPVSRSTAHFANPKRLHEEVVFRQRPWTNNKKKANTTTKAPTTASNNHPGGKRRSTPQHSFFASGTGPATATLPTQNVKRNFALRPKRTSPGFTISSNPAAWPTAEEQREPDQVTATLGGANNNSSNRC